jgi:membrane associated rhomboid family serine protease
VFSESCFNIRRLIRYAAKSLLEGAGVKHPFQEHPTIFAIIALAAIVFVLDTSGQLNNHPEYGVVPLHVEQAWTSLIHGTIDAARLGVLLTTVTSLFMHGDLTHLLMNSVFLWMFGSLVSQHLGKWWALAAFFFCGAGGAVLHILLNRGSEIPCIGASGAVSGFEGIYLGLALRWRLDWPDVWPLARPIPPSQLCLFAAIGIGFDFMGLATQGQGIAFGAHIGGFATGLAVAAILTQIYPSLQRWKSSGWRA